MDSPDFIVYSFKWKSSSVKVLTVLQLEISGFKGPDNLMAIRALPQDRNRLKANSVDVDYLAMLIIAKSADLDDVAIHLLMIANSADLGNVAILMIAKSADQDEMPHGIPSWSTLFATVHSMGYHI